MSGNGTSATCFNDHFLDRRDPRQDLPMLDRQLAKFVGPGDQGCGLNQYEFQPVGIQSRKSSSSIVQ